jgi:hypothetical protein
VVHCVSRFIRRAGAALCPTTPARRSYPREFAAIDALATLSFVQLPRRLPPVSARRCAHRELPAQRAATKRPRIPFRSFPGDREDVNRPLNGRRGADSAGAGCEPRVDTVVDPNVEHPYRWSTLEAYEYTNPH